MHKTKSTKWILVGCVPMNIFAPAFDSSHTSLSEDPSLAQYIMESKLNRIRGKWNRSSNG